MNTRRGSLAFMLLLAALAAFVVVTSRALPPVVASHFGLGGVPNGFMPRGTYTVIMLVLVVVPPSLLVFLPASAVRKGGARLNIPNREYWLAPERREATAAYLSRQSKLFAAAVALFLGYTHWLVVRANSSAPVALPEAPFYAGLGTFLIVVLLWVLALYAHFGRRA
jgi:hypothetical protein